MSSKYFTLDEARALLPELRALLLQANKQLEPKLRRLQELNSLYLEAETALEDCQAPEDNDQRGLTEFREQRKTFERAIDELARAQSDYLKSLEEWVDKISESGIILRRLKEGLVDFPARKGQFEYYLCWQLDEADINHWHPLEDGFSGRKSLSSLLEYC